MAVDAWFHRPDFDIVHTNDVVVVGIAGEP